MLPPKQFLFGDEARRELLTGITLMRDAVTCTIGPNGRDAAIDRYGQVDITKDGVTVMHDTVAKDEWAEMGCRMVREASSKTNDDAGDGTTTAIEIAWAIASEGLKRVQKGTNVIKMKVGVTKAVDKVVETLKLFSVDITDEKDYANVAAIAAQDKDLGKQVAEIYLKAGDNGVVDIERMDEVGIKTEHTSGMQFDEGWVRPEFINVRSSLSFEVADAPILVTDRELTGNSELLPMVKHLNNMGIKKCLIVAEHFGGEALASLMKNAMAGSFRCCCVKAPAFGPRKAEILKDICAMTGATLVSEETGIRLDAMQPEHFGKARNVTVKQKNTVITMDEDHEITRDGEQVTVKELVFERIETLNNQIKESETGYEREKMKERLATLTDGVAIIKLGAATDIERIRIKRAVEDAVCAVQAAREEGVVPGGGTALVRCIEALNSIEVTHPDEQSGIDIVKEALESPARRILDVAGEDPGMIVATVKQKKGNVGYNMDTGEYEDLMKLGVVDPTKVVRCALENGASCAKQFLGTEVAITQYVEEKEEKKD